MKKGASTEKESNNHRSNLSLSVHFRKQQVTADRGGAVELQHPLNRKKLAPARKKRFLSVPIGKEATLLHIIYMKLRRILFPYFSFQWLH